MIVNIVRMVLECVKIWAVLCGILNYKRKEKPMAAIVLFVVCVALAAVKGIQEPEYKLSTFTALPVVICALAIEGKRRFLVSFLSFLGICCIDDTFFFLMKWIFIIPESALETNSNLFMVVGTVSVIPLVLTAYGLQRLYKKRNDVGESVKSMATPGLVLTVIGLFVVSILFSGFNRMDFSRNERMARIIGGSICLFSIAFLAIFFLLLYNNYSRKQYKHLLEMNEKMLKYKEEYYEKQLENETETRKFRHDIANHILCLDILLKGKEYEEAKKYLESIRGSLNELRPKCQTGNRLVNAIVNDISGKYQDVMLNWDGNFPQETQLSNPDICVIFANILENAFYAADGCDEDKKVNVKIQGVGNSIKILVENPTAHPVQEKEGRFVSQKADKKNHGFGTMNVKERVGANGGSVEYSYTQDTFTTKILLPNVF